MVVAVELEVAGRDPQVELVGELLHRNDRGVFGHDAGGGEVVLVLRAAEIGAFEQLGRKDDLCAFARRLANEVGDVGDVALRVFGKRELERGDGEFGHLGTCWLMQWKLPPPVRRWSARRPIALRSGKIAWTTSTAASSSGAP